MVLIGEILGVLLGGAALAAYVRTPLRRAGGVAVAVVGVAALLFFENGSQFVKALPNEVSANDALTPAQIANAEPAAFGAANTPFFQWVRNQIVSAHRGLKFWISPISPTTESFLYQWSSYALLPGVWVTNQQNADWLVFYGVYPSQVPYDTAAFKPPVVFQPGYAIAERIH